MSSPSTSFGREALSVQSADGLLALEQAHDKGGRFAVLDAALGHLLVRALQGRRIIGRPEGGDRRLVVYVDGDYRSFLDRTFSVEVQQSRGAWFLPEKVAVRVGVINLAAVVADYGRFGTGMAWDWVLDEETPLKGSPDAVFAWSVLEPAVADIFLPLRLRGPWAGKKSREEQEDAWMRIDALNDALGFALAGQLAPMRYGGGWNRLGADAQFEAKRCFLITVAEQVNARVGERYRAVQLLHLIRRYYEKADRNGQAVRRRVISTAPFKRALSGYFEGDWLAFLTYIGEQAHPREQIASTLPEKRLHVGGKKRAMELAAEKNVPVAEVERIAAALFKSSAGVSPVEERVGLLSDYWREFEDIHDRQTPGMAPLWGLVEESGQIDLGNVPSQVHRRGLYRELLSGPLLTRIEALWSTVLLARWPERMATEPFPHTLLKLAAGPGLEFWHGVALTVWFVCEGPMSRTDIPGISRYFRSQVDALRELGVPIDARFFDDLTREAGRLGLNGPASYSPERERITPGLVVPTNFYSGSRRDGFQQLRDIISKYRREWTDRHLQAYWRGRWEPEISQAQRRFHVLLADRGKPPTARQFAAHVTSATNHWFGGDLSRLYGAIGEQTPVHPEYHPILPLVAPDPEVFARSVLSGIGGNPDYRGYVGNPTPAQRKEHERQSALRGIARTSMRYLQLEEAIGSVPTLAQFGRSNFDRAVRVLGDNPEGLWDKYVAAIEVAKRGTPAAGPTLSQQAQASSVLGSRDARDEPRVPHTASRDTSPARHSRWLDRIRLAWKGHR